MLNKILLAAIALVFFAGCTDFDEEWHNAQFQGRAFKKLAVVGLSHELERRQIYEEVGVEAFGKYGLKAIKGLSIFPQVVTEQQHNADTITKLIIAHQVDAVLVVKILHEDDLTYMMPEDHKRFMMVYGRWGRGKNLSLSGAYYTKPDKYFMIATLYDLHEKHEENEETVVWRAVNEVINPDTGIGKKKKFVRTAIKHLIKQQLVRVE